MNLSLEGSCIRVSVKFQQTYLITFNMYHLNSFYAQTSKTYFLYHNFMHTMSIAKSKVPRCHLPRQRDILFFFSLFDFMSLRNSKICRTPRIISTLEEKKTGIRVKTMPKSELKRMNYRKRAQPNQTALGRPSQAGPLLGYASRWHELVARP